MNSKEHLSKKWWNHENHLISRHFTFHVQNGLFWLFQHSLAVRVVYQQKVLNGTHGMAVKHSFARFQKLAMQTSCVQSVGMNQKEHLNKKWWNRDNHTISHHFTLFRWNFLAGGNFVDILASRQKLFIIRSEIALKGIWVMLRKTIAPSNTIWLVSRWP